MAKSDRKVAAPLYHFNINKHFTLKMQISDLKIKFVKK